MHLHIVNNYFTDALFKIMGPTLCIDRKLFEKDNTDLWAKLNSVGPKRFIEQTNVYGRPQMARRFGRSYFSVKYMIPLM